MMKLLGVTDERTTCDCCGKTHLKRTVALGTETGIVYYGVNCAARALGKKSSAYKVEVDAMEYAQALLKKFGPESAVRGIWNQFGFSCEIKNGKLIIWGVGELEVPHE